MEWYLPVIWAGLIGVAVALYVILDGFDLGIGILFPAYRQERHRDLMVNTVAPFWDGNETWLVLGGAGLLVAFPKAYAVLMPAMYIPIILMLLALVFRGVAFEFRWVARTSKIWWDRAFWLGSTLAAFFQGVILGGMIQGVTVAGGQFAGGAFDWATRFSFLCGLGVVAGYALLGATWLVMKTEGALQDWARTKARLASFGVIAFIVLVSVWTPFLHEHIAARWFSWPNLLFFSPVPVITGLLFLWLWRALERGEAAPFLAAMGLFALCYLGLAISLFPYVVPHSLTLWDAATAPEGGRSRGQLGLYDKLSGMPAPSPINHPYIAGTDDADTLALHIGQTVTLTLLMHPTGKATLTSGVLPRKALALARDWVGPGLAAIAPSLRTGPVLVETDLAVEGQVRLPKVSVFGKDQNFLWRDTPATWRTDAILAATQAALLPDSPAELREGWIRVAPDTGNDDT